MPYWGTRHMALLGYTSYGLTGVHVIADDTHAGTLLQYFYRMAAGLRALRTRCSAAHNRVAFSVDWTVPGQFRVPRTLVTYSPVDSPLNQVDGTTVYSHIPC